MENNPSVSGYSRRQLLRAVGVVGSSLVMGTGVAAATPSDTQFAGVPTGHTVPTTNIKEVPSVEINYTQTDIENGRTPMETDPEGVRSALSMNTSPPEPTQINANDSSSSPTGTQSESDGNPLFNYLTQAKFKTFNPLTFFDGYFIVPPKPEDYNTVQDPNMYYFPGFISQETSPGIIIQPVLQWNRFQQFEGEWSISAWIVKDTDPVTATHSEPVAVSPGDRLHALMIDIGSAWGISLTRMDDLEVTRLFTDDLSDRRFTDARCVLEDNYWDHTSCNQLPGGCTFTDMEVHTESGELQLGWSGDVCFCTTCLSLGYHTDGTTVSLHT